MNQQYDSYEKYANFVWISMEVKLLLQVKMQENKIWKLFST